MRSAIYATGAFSNLTTSREASVDVVGDNAGYLVLTPGENGEYTNQNGELQLQLNGALEGEDAPSGSGVNIKAASDLKRRDYSPAEVSHLVKQSKKSYVNNKGILTQAQKRADQGLPKDDVKYYVENVSLKNHSSHVHTELAHEHSTPALIDDTERTQSTHSATNDAFTPSLDLVRSNQRRIRTAARHSHHTRWRARCVLDSTIRRFPIPE